MRPVVKESKITFRSVLLGTVFAGLFAVLTVYFENRVNRIATATQIAVFPFVLLLLTTLLINPACRLARFIRQFTAAEILIIFVMGSVSAGISTFGMASQVVPLVGSLFNGYWNSDQTEWNRYVEPFLKESYFLGEPGIEQASGDYRRALLALEAARTGREAALNYKRATDVVGRAEKDMEKARAAAGSEAERALRISHIEHVLKGAGKIQARAEKAWNAVRREKELGTMQHVLDTSPDRIQELRNVMAAKRSALGELEAKAFRKVEVFRRGLAVEGKDLRAHPGFLILPGENIEIYMARLRRLRRGLAALGSLRGAKEILEAADPDVPPAGELLDRVDSLIQSAIDRLKTVGVTEQLLSRRTLLADEWDMHNDRLLEASSQLDKFRQERAWAQPSDFSRLDAQIKEWSNLEKVLLAEKEGADRRREQFRVRLEGAEKVSPVTAELKAIKERMAKQDVPNAAVAADLHSVMKRFPSFDASLRRFVIGDVPWAQWLGPLARWAVLIGLTYLVLMTFNVLIFRQWAHNERLIYPLAKLPMMLAGAEGEDPQSSGAALFGNGLFWAGVGVSGSVLGWNLLCGAGVVPGLGVIDITIEWKTYIAQSSLQGLLPTAKSSIFFTMIGLAFLIPAEISFSLWLFRVLYMVQLLIIVRLGHGVNEDSFPIGWWYTFNFQTAEGAGALMVFAAVVLYRCRQYILCFFRSSSVQELESAEQKELRISSFLFLFGSLALILLLWKGMGANIFYTVLCYSVVMIITIGLVRAVTEGGILGFQAWAGPFHLIRTFFGMNRSWTAPSLYAPLMAYYSIMFLDIKTFIAPAMANSIKIRDELKMGRLRFHTAIFLGIGIAAFTAIAAHLIMSYSQGADAMHDWFYVGFPKDVFDKIALIGKTSPIDTTASRWWLAFGGVGMAALLYLRQNFFWLPHPIGMIMLVNPMMGPYWFSIFLGWLFKRLVTKYGSKEAYVKARTFFIGLIVGELLLVVLAMIVSCKTGLSIPIDLNRNNR